MPNGRKIPENIAESVNAVVHLQTYHANGRSTRNTKRSTAAILPFLFNGVYPPTFSERG